jgi:hypothetical protein
MYSCTGVKSRPFLYISTGIEIKSMYSCTGAKSRPFCKYFNWNRN